MKWRTIATDRSAWEKFTQGLGPAPVKRNAREHKYGARHCRVDGFGFDSSREAARYQELKLLAAAGAITELELQPCFPLQVVRLYRDGPPWEVEHCGFFTADFRYTDTSSGEIVVEDVKSEPTKTTAYRLRKRLAQAIHGITICEV